MIARLDRLAAAPAVEPGVLHRKGSEELVEHLVGVDEEQPVAFLRATGFTDALRKPKLAARDDDRGAADLDELDGLS